MALKSLAEGNRWPVAQAAMYNIANYDKSQGPALLALLFFHEARASLL
jgi:hypothetical protein